MSLPPYMAKESEVIYGNKGTMKIKGGDYMDGRKTPLYERHKELGGRVVDYAGWLLPVQYSGLIDEHHAVREKAGIFDVSHMGEIIVEGPEALDFLEMMFTNEVVKAKIGQAIYGMFLRDTGYVVDDLLIYRLDEEKYMLVVNAANAEKDFQWLQDHVGDYDVKLDDISEDVGLIALQGPLAQEILQELTEQDLDEIKPFRFLQDVEVAGVNALISRTGYTGEDGFELYVKAEDTIAVWDEILDKGGDRVMPAGLGCRDTLRFEAGLPLYGHEISEEVNPLEGGLGFFVKLKKEPEFIGQKALREQKENGLNRKLVGIELLGRGMLREDYPLIVDGEEVGYITTGYLSPTLEKNIGNALIKPEFSEIGQEVLVGIRKKQVEAKVISRKFLDGGK